MPTAPANPVSSDIANRGERFAVFIGAQGGTAISADDERDDVQLITLMRSAGGSRLDAAELAFSLIQSETRLKDIETPIEFKRKVQVRTAIEDEEEQAILLFHGEMAAQNIKINRSEGEQARLQARLEHWHLGEPLVGPKVLDTDGITVRTPHMPIQFNPLIDGKIEANMSSAVNASAASSHLWVSPESVRTAAARTANAQTASEWTLARAVHSLCWAANPSETFITNPTYEELIGDPNASPPSTGPFTDAPDVKNVELPRGRYLPELLDLLLQPFGYSWFVSPSLEDDGTAKNNLRFFKLGQGQEVEVYFQRPGEDLDLALSNVPNLEIGWNIADVANVIIGHGSQKEIELTVELYRGWAESDDALTADDLVRVDGDSDADALIYSQFKEKPNVWRKWVLNEGGDYCSTRTSVRPIPADPFDLTSILGPLSVPRRRKFGRCLALDIDRDRRAPYIEYRDPAVAGDNDPGAWKPLDSDALQIQERPEILDKECGIYFGGARPPAALIALGANARLRITATIKADDRLAYTTSRGLAGPNGNEIELFVDLSDRFHYRKHCTVADYASIFAADSGGFDTVDHTSDLEEFCRALRDVEQACRLTCDFTLFGIHPQYEIGQVVTRVNGRDIQLNRNAADWATKLYPQITSITYDRANQATRLKVETFDLPAKALRKLQF